MLAAFNIERRPDIRATRVKCTQCKREIVNTTTGILPGDCPFCGGTTAAVFGQWGAA